MWWWLQLAHIILHMWFKTTAALFPAALFPAFILVNWLPALHTLCRLEITWHWYSNYLFKGCCVHALCMQGVSCWWFFSLFPTVLEGKELETNSLESSRQEMCQSLLLERMRQLKTTRCSVEGCGFFSLQLHHHVLHMEIEAASYAAHKGNMALYLGKIKVLVALHPDIPELEAYLIITYVGLLINHAPESTVFDTSYMCFRVE